MKQKKIIIFAANNECSKIDFYNQKGNTNNEANAINKSVCCNMWIGAQFLFYTYANNSRSTCAIYY